jgi:hypothetical protein
MAPQVDYFLDDDDIKDADAAGRFLFDVPPDAVVRGNVKDGNDDKYKATWTQTLEVIEAKMYEDSTKDKQGNEYASVCVEVVFQVPSSAIRSQDGLPDPNAGKQARAWYRMVPAAQRNKQHPKFKANNWALGRLLGILRSIWGAEVIPHGTRPNLGEFYSGDQPPVVGKTVVATVKQYRYDGNLKDELTDFVELGLQGV